VHSQIGVHYAGARVVSHVHGAEMMMMMMMMMTPVERQLFDVACPEAREEIEHDRAQRRRWQCRPRAGVFCAVSLSSVAACDVDHMTDTRVACVGV